MRIGPHAIEPPLILAPMAGVTDKPFRLLSKRLGAGYAVSEMTTSDPRLWRTRKSRQRLDHDGEPAPIGVQRPRRTRGSAGTSRGGPKKPGAGRSRTCTRRSNSAFFTKRQVIS